LVRRKGCTFLFNLKCTFLCKNMQTKCCKNILQYYLAPGLQRSAWRFENKYL
jgi:hypothetical protein